MGVNNVSLRVNFNSGNAALVDDPRAETARILNDIRARVEGGEEYSAIFDLNGNYIGDWSLDVEEDDESTD